MTAWDVVGRFPCMRYGGLMRHGTSFSHMNATVDDPWPESRLSHTSLLMKSGINPNIMLFHK